MSDKEILVKMSEQVLVRMSTADKKLCLMKSEILDVTPQEYIRMSFRENRGKEFMKCVDRIEKSVELRNNRLLELIYFHVKAINKRNDKNCVFEMLDELMKKIGEIK